MNELDKIDLLLILGLFKYAWDCVSNVRLKLCDNILNLRKYIEFND